MFYVRFDLKLHDNEQVEFFGHAEVANDKFNHCSGNGAETIEVSAWSTLPFVAVVRGMSRDLEPRVLVFHAASLPHTAERTE